jgi:nucleotide-binding universal stress UspA family protein
MRSFGRHAHLGLRDPRRGRPLQRDGGSPPCPEPAACRPGRRELVTTSSRQRARPDTARPRCRLAAALGDRERRARARRPPAVGSACRSGGSSVRGAGPTLGDIPGLGQRFRRALRVRTSAVPFPICVARARDSWLCPGHVAMRPCRQRQTPMKDPRIDKDFTRVPRTGRRLSGTLPPEMQRKRWIVVGTDFSEAAEGALRHAVSLASESRANVACVHAFEDPPSVALLPDPTPNLRSELADAVARSGADCQGVHVEFLVRRGAPWEKLLNVAADLGADLIVVGAKGQRATMHGLFLGSVATRLAATSPRCVLVVPAPPSRVSFRPSPEP